MRMRQNLRLLKNVARIDCAAQRRAVTGKVGRMLYLRLTSDSTRQAGFDFGDRLRAAGQRPPNFQLQRHIQDAER